MRATRPFTSTRFGPLRGREGDVARLRAALLGPSPIIAVTGLPGVGKTRLVADVVGDEAVWLSARDVGVDTSLDVVLEQCALRVGQDTPFARGPILVVLDGLDRDDLADALAHHVDEHPAIRFIITLRGRLACRGVATVRVNPLELPRHAVAMLTEEGRGAAVTCFMDHARTADAECELNRENVTHVMALLRTTGGLPLAIELVTAWLGTMSIEALAWAATDMSGLDAQAVGDADATRENLARALDVAVNSIPTGSADLARAIAEFRGPAPLDAVGEMIGERVGRGALLGLIDSGLVWTTDVNGDSHVAMLPLVAERLRERAAEQHHRSMYLDWLTALVDRHAPSLNRHGHALAVQLLEPHVDSLPRLNELFDQGDERLAVMTLALLPYWRSSNRYREAGERVDVALRSVGVDSPLADWLRLGAARAETEIGDSARAHRLLASFVLNPKLPSALRATAASELWDLERMSNEAVDRSLIDAGRSLVSGDAPGSVPPCVRTWIEDAQLAFGIEAGDRRWSDGDLEGARHAYRSATRAAGDRGSLTIAALALANLASAYQVSGMLTEALATQEEVREISRALGPRSNLRIHDDVMRAMLLVELGANDEARTLALRVIDEAPVLDSPFFVEQALRCMGLVLAETGDVPEARNALRRSLAMSEVVGRDIVRARCVAAVAVAAPPVGAEAPERAVLLAAARAAAPRLSDELYGPWSARGTEPPPLDGPTIGLADALTLALTVLEQRSFSPAVPTLTGITPREAEVLEMLVGGMTDRQIAGRLVVSIRTAEAHVAAILRKLGASNRRVAAQIATNAGVQPCVVTYPAIARIS